MTRWLVTRLVLAAALLLPVLAGIGLSHASAAPGSAERLGDLAAPASLAHAAAPAPHFGFSLLNQAGSTQVTKTVTSGTGAAGSQVTYSIVIQAPPFAPPGNVLPASFNVREFIPSSQTFVSVSVTSPAGPTVTNPCPLAASNAPVPAGGDPASTQYLCTISGVPAGTGSLTLQLVTQVNSGTFSGAQLTNVAAAPASPEDPLVLAPAPPAIDSATISTPLTPIVTPVPTPPVFVPPPFLAPPPPPLPLLPPPPPPMPPVGGMQRPMQRMAPAASVPVIPEADSLPLVVGGLLALGGVALWRVRGRREP